MESSTETQPDEYRLQLALGADVYQQVHDLDRETALGADFVPTADLSEAAAEVVVAWGCCLLRGIPITSEQADPGVPVMTSAVAMPALKSWGESLLEDFCGLPQKWDPQELEFGSDYCLHLVEQRHEAWAAIAAVKSGIESEREAHEYLGFSLSSLDKSICAVQTILDELDQFGRHDWPLKNVLQTILDYPLQQNLKESLVAPYRDDLPWWLDGSLQDFAWDQLDTLGPRAADQSFTVLSAEPAQDSQTQGPASVVRKQAGIPPYSSLCQVTSVAASGQDGQSTRVRLERWLPTEACTESASLEFIDIRLEGGPDVVTIIIMLNDSDRDTPRQEAVQGVFLHALAFTIPLEDSNVSMDVPVAKFSELALALDQQSVLQIAGETWRLDPSSVEQR